MKVPKTVIGQTSHAKGMAAEDIAAEYLSGKGFEILERRYKSRFGEIDILAREGETIVAVEVKMRTDLNQALESITPRSQKRIERCLLDYLSHHEALLDVPLRFDVVAISAMLVIHHLDNAWMA